jgi:Protein of unknown function (DUF4232)
MKLTLMRKVFAVAGTGVLFTFGFPLFGPSSGSLPAVASSVPLCRGNDFLGGWVGTNGATGTSIFQVAFVNNGSTTCRLAGYPTIVGYRDGREYPLKVGHLKGKVFDLSPTVVAPRMSAQMIITTSASCNALNTGGQSTIKKVIARTTYSVGVRFPGSKYPIAVLGLNVDVACGLDVTQIGWR